MAFRENTAEKVGSDSGSPLLILKTVSPRSYHQKAPDYHNSPEVWQKGNPPKCFPHTRRAAFLVNRKLNTSVKCNNGMAQQLFLPQSLRICLGTDKFSGCAAGAQAASNPKFCSCIRKASLGQKDQEMQWCWGILVPPPRTGLNRKH